MFAGVKPPCKNDDLLGGEWVSFLVLYYIHTTTRHKLSLPLSVLRHSFARAIQIDLGTDPGTQC